MQRRSTRLPLAATLLAAPLLALVQTDTVLAPERETPTVESLGGDTTVSADITAEELKGHVQALSSDALRGRRMGAPESMVAAQYCIERLAAAGLEPGGDDGTWLQIIPCERTVYDDVPTLSIGKATDVMEEFANGRDFTFRARGRVAATGPLTLVHIDEEEEMPTEADPRVALVLHTSGGRARRWLRNAGHPDGMGFGLVILPNAKDERGEPETPRSGRMAPRSDERTAPPQLAVRGPLAELLDERTPRVVAFDPHARVETQDDANVVGVLPGTKAGTEDEEFLLLCAHRDHVGTMRVAPGQPEPEDTIFNGADDDASGCSFVLELAEAIAARPERSPRTLVVTLVTGEEAGGFVGSAHYAAHPAVPLESTVCALNFEMTGRPDELVGGAGGLWLTGDDRSDLGPKLRMKGFAIQPDPRPEGNFFVRSDNVSFARVGVVSQTVSSYNMHQDYHRVTDEWDTLDYAHMETGARISLDAVQSLLAGDWTPSWNEGQPGL